MRSMRVWSLLIAVGLVGCDDSVTGDLRLIVALGSRDATAHATLWEYDPGLADGSATAIARFERADLFDGAKSVPFTLVPDHADSGLGHYVTAWIDVDSDGIAEVGDYGVIDFNRVELGDDGVEVFLEPRSSVAVPEAVPCCP
jgi:hypothetical protein